MFRPTYAPRTKLPDGHVDDFSPAGPSRYPPHGEESRRAPRGDAAAHPGCALSALARRRQLRNRSASQPGQHLAVKRIATVAVARRSAFTPRFRR